MTAKGQNVNTGEINLLFFFSFYVCILSQLVEKERKYRGRATRLKRTLMKGRGKGREGRREPGCWYLGGGRAGGFKGSCVVRELAGETGRAGGHGRCGW